NPATLACGGTGVNSPCARAAVGYNQGLRQGAEEPRGVARMGIDAQRSGASELPDRAAEVRRGRIAYPLPSGCPGTPWYARRELGRATAAVRTSDEPSRRKAMS